MGKFLEYLFGPLMHVSPFILSKMIPILVDSDIKLWKAAYPLAAAIVKDLTHSDLQGLARHAAAVKELEVQVIALGKFELDKIKTFHFGQLILAAYANEFGLGPDPLAAIIPVPVLAGVPVAGPAAASIIEPQRVL